jgi:hypothetical protein
MKNRAPDYRSESSLDSSYPSVIGAQSADVGTRFNRGVAVKYL